MSMIRCIWPVDGSIYAERPELSHIVADAAVARARTAQKDRAALSLEARRALVAASIAALGAANDRVVEDLAWQMGRPTRYGGEIGGVNERAG